MTQARYAIGIDLGGTCVKFALVRDDGQMLESGSIPTQKDLPAAKFVKVIADAAMAMARPHDHPISAIGFGSAGLVDHQRGTIQRATNLPAFDHTPVTQMISDLTGCNAMLDNDANVAAFGEYAMLRQADEDLQSLAMLVIGTGIGGGLILDGRVWRGQGMAGEIGHFIVEPGGILCTCGQRGCLEQYASASAIQRRAAEELSSESGQLLDCEQVIELASKGQSQAVAIMQDVYRHLAITCINLARLLDLDAIVLGGGVANAGLPLRQGVEEAFAEHDWQLGRRTQIRLARLGNQAGCIGAALLALRDAVSQPVQS